MARKFPDDDIERDVVGNTLTVQSIILQRYLCRSEFKGWRLSWRLKISTIYLHLQKNFYNRL